MSSASVLRRVCSAIPLAPVLLACVLAAAPARIAAADRVLVRDMGGAGRTFDGEIVVGATFPLTGKFENYGQSAFYGALTRVRAINDAGGVNGRRLVVDWRDNMSDPELAAHQIEAFAVERKLPAAIGPLLSDATLAAQPLAEKHKFVIITPMAANDALIREGEWIFRVSFNNSAQALSLVRFQTERFGRRNAAILYDPRHGFSTELSTLFEFHFFRAKGTIADSLSLLNLRGQVDLARQLRRIAEKKPDFIFAPLYAGEAVELMRALKDLGLDIPVCGSDTWDNEMVFDAAGRRLAGTAFASPLFERTSEYRPFREFFEAMERAGMENPDAQAAYAWDAVSLLAEGLRRGGETSEALREGLMGVRDLELATGALTILENRETRKPVLVRVVEERAGRLLPVFAERYDP